MKKEATHEGLGGGAGQIRCPSCGASYEPTQTACPYCGAMNYSASEEAYFDKLEDLQGHMEELKAMPGRETGRELAKSGRRLWKILAAILALALLATGIRQVLWERDRRQDRENYVWKAENYPILDQYYEDGDYQGMIAFFRDVSAEGKPVWDWEHTELCMALLDMEALDDLYREEREYPEDYERTKSILYEELNLLGMPYRYGIPRRDLETVRGMSVPYLEDLRTRFSLSEEEIDGLERELQSGYGYPDLKRVEEFLKERES